MAGRLSQQKTISGGEFTTTLGGNNIDVRDKTVIFFNTTSGNLILTGLVNGVAGQRVYIVKNIEANNLDIYHEAGSGNQDIRCFDGNDISIGEFGGVTLVCDGVYWYVVGYVAQ